MNVCVETDVPVAPPAIAVPLVVMYRGYSDHGIIDFGGRGMSRDGVMNVQSKCEFVKGAPDHMLEYATDNVIGTDVVVLAT